MRKIKKASLCCCFVFLAVCSCQAPQDQLRYALSVSANPRAGGSVWPSGGGFEKGRTITVRATPNDGYEFDGWFRDNQRISGKTSMTIIIDGNVHITARFLQIFATYTLNIQAESGGSVSPSGGEKHHRGKQITIKARPDSEHRFTGWSGLPKEEWPNKRNSEARIVLNRNLSLTANFGSKYIGARTDKIFFTTTSSEQQYFAKEGSGPVKVILSDIFLKRDESSGDWLFNKDTHGFRVRNTFKQYAKPNYTLYSFHGNSGTSFRAVHTPKTETIIVSASAHMSEPLQLTQRSRDEAEQLKKTNALYLMSLENIGIKGTSERVYPYPHAANAYEIQNDTAALAKTIFVAWASNNGTNSEGNVDLHGGFVERNLDHTIFVQLPKGFPNRSTSHATPFLAAFAVDVLHANRSLSAETLKTEIMNKTVWKNNFPVSDWEYDEGLNVDKEVSKNLRVRILPLSAR